MGRWIAVVLFVVGGAWAPARAEDPGTARIPTLTGRLEIVAGQQVLTLWGTARERGFAHGYLLAEPIRNALDHDFERVLGKFVPLYETVVRRGVVSKFAFEQHELEELEGLFEGLVARLPEDRLLVSALGRPFDLLDLKALNTFGDWYGLGCSSLAVWGERTVDGKPLVGRNFDFAGFELILASQFVFVRAPDGDRRGTVGVGYPGSIGVLTGMNADGVFVAVHDVRIKPALDKAMRANVPRLLAARRILERVTPEGAVGEAHVLAREWPTLYGNNFMVVAPRAAGGLPIAGVLEYDCRIDLEDGCTLRCVPGAASADDPPILCLACTNHHRSRPEPEGLTEREPRWRYPVLEAAGEAPAERFDVGRLFAWMGRASYPKDAAPQQLADGPEGDALRHGTLHQVVAEPALARFHVRLGVVGKHITDVSAQTHDVPALIKAATPD